VHSRPGGSTASRWAVFKKKGGNMKGENNFSFAERVKEAILSHFAEAFAISLTTLLIWIAYEIAPKILPVINEVVSKEVLLALLLVSIILNIIFVIISLSKRETLKLKYGIYWDNKKNPYCPSCKKPGLQYDKWTGGYGYYCLPCNKVFALTDNLGNQIKPLQAIKEL
jgi:hypothetical protein